MIQINLNTLILRPVGQVFDYISTPENNAQWQYGSFLSAHVSEGDTKVGSTFNSLGHFMGRRILSAFEVTEFEQDKKYGFKTISGPVQMQTLYTFEAVDGGTHVVSSTQVNPGRFFELLEPLVARQARTQFKENLAKLKQLLESR